MDNKTDESPVVRISVRNLVEFILRSGDLDNRLAAGGDREAMLMGGRIHRKIQKQMGSGYFAEVSLKHLIPCGGFSIQVEGRADGIIIEDDHVCVDEIKGILGDIRKLEEPVPVHLAQAKCYAYIYALQKEHSAIGVQMTYCQMESEEIRRFQQEYTFEELEVWFLGLVASYEKWARFQMEWRIERNASIKAVEFPFDYRDGQKDLVTAVYKTILRKKQLFIQAPTGVGKTMATAFPAVKAVGEGLGEKIFYLTAKTITRTVAEQAFQKLKKQGLRYKVITLTAKDKICFCEETNCNPEYCQYAKGHYDRVNDAVYELLMKKSELDRSAIEAQAKEHQVCPFELSLDVSTWADAVICDYNYVFDPNAHLKRFFSEGVSGEYLFLIDEAHNLVERGREMYSAVLYKEDILAVKKAVLTEWPGLSRKLDVCNKQMLELKRESDICQVHNSVSHISLNLLNVLNEMENFFEETHSEELTEKVRDLYFDVRQFLMVHDWLDENYLIYSELEQGGRFALKLFCVNPALRLKEYLDMGNSAVFFSATLLPIQYYKRLLSMNWDDYAVYADSPFDINRRRLLIGTDVSTKYTRRNDEMYRRYASYLYETIRAKTGNYMAFFPSYQFLEEVCMCFRDYVNGEADVVVQKQSMDESEREEFLAAFESERGKSLIGFCVMGGIFSEGIDLANDKLIGAMIVGTGLPQVCNERELLREYFENNGGSGFEYAYLYPGMNKVLQSAGRVIRTEEDEGVILLLDERFRDSRYQKSFPREWKELRLCSANKIGSLVQSFWKEREEAVKPLPPTDRNNP